MNLHIIGEADGVPVTEVAIASRAGARAKIMSWGAVVRDLEVPVAGGMQRVVLGLDTLADHVAHSPHFGAIAGRFANRIANGEVTLDGVARRLPRNQGGLHSLHGGGQGFGKRPWKLVSHDAHSVTLRLVSPDGDAGYPGTIEVTCTYRLLEPAILEVELHATCDAPTIVNLAHHSYFNLDGSADARDHELQMDAAFYTPVDADLIPTGEVRAVAGTPFDFTKARAVRNAGGELYDHNFVLSRWPDADTGLAHAATLRSRRNGLAMEVHTTEPAVQFYDGAKLALPVAGLGGARYGAHAGFCFEPQVFPDAPNRRHFPNAALRPGDAYRQVTQYRFG